MTIVKSLWLFLGIATTTVAMLFSSTAVWELLARADEPTEDTQRSVPFTGSRLKIEVVEGAVDVAVEPGAAGAITLRRALQWSGDKPKVKEEWDGGVLRLSATCPGADQPDGPTCQASYVISVPPETALDASTISGELDVRGIYGALRLSSVSGDVEAGQTPASLWARTQTGNVNAHDLRGGPADVEIGKGNADLSYSKAPSDVSVIVRASGDIRLNLPTGEPYAITTSGENVDTTGEVLAEPTSPRKIVARTAEGNVWISGR
ncbi:hypothetical protein ACIBG8_42095 [Nonomuraea sp. NPDC050556]|uniref:hypothetical protein n=1 Tax=Nonomuraea sp. NPDC050556 TaxID=3364369 RepID=UPI00379A45FD